MICNKCGAKQENSGFYCQYCGESFTAKELKKDDPILESTHLTTENENLSVSNKLSSNIIKDEEGGYQWMYEYSFWKNPSILITLYMVMLISCAFPAGLMLLLSLGEGVLEALRIALTVFGICAMILIPLVSIAYLFLGLLYGGKYYVLFKMDDQGINHIQLAKQFKKAQALAFLMTMVGLAAGSATTAGAGLVGATKQSLYTSFKKVKTIKVKKNRKTIYLNESLNRNQIYADKKDIDFIVNYIINHCSDQVKISK